MNQKYEGVIHKEPSSYVKSIHTTAGLETFMMEKQSDDAGFY